MTANNPNLDLVSINSNTKFGQNLSICSQDIERNSKSGVNQGPYNSGTSLRKIMCNNPHVDLVNMNAYIKFGENLSICSQDIEGK